MIFGIIGGNGVAATNKLNDMIEYEFTKNGAFRDCHHPEIIIWQATQVPSRSMYLEGRGESFIPDYVRIAKILKGCGASKICMCCNTAHFAIDEISKEADVAMINIIEQVAKIVKSSGVKSVGIMASDGCVKHKLYDKYFSKICPDVKIIYPDSEYQAMVTKGICNVKNSHRFDDEQSEENPAFLFKKVTKHLKAQGAEKVISGCTDIRVVYRDENEIDSLEALKDAIIEQSKNI